VRALIRCALPFAVLLLALVPMARAHLGHVVLRAERYIKVDAAPDEARIVISMSMGRSPMHRVLEAADAEGDRDGRVTPAEAQAYLERWAEGLAEELPIERNGTPVSVRWGDGYLSPLGPVQAVPGVVEMVARVPLDGGRHTLVVRDRMRPEVADRTDVAFRARDGVEIVASGMSEEPDRVLPDLAYGPDLVEAGKADAITVILDVPGPSRRERVTLYGGLVLLVLLAGGSWIALRRRR
jgi:hypothetical protein